MARTDAALAADPCVGWAIVVRAAGHPTRHGEALTGWDRAAFVSSWVAPWSLGIMVISLLLATKAREPGALHAYETFLQLGVLVCGAVGALAHLILTYRVHKDLRDGKLATMLKFGFGYSAARKALRCQGRRPREGASSHPTMGSS